MSLARAKGALGENKALDMLQSYYPELVFERVPGSGNGKIKGDIYIPNANSVFCIEVKNYADSHFNDTILTNKSNLIVKWWNKLLLEARRESKLPLLIFRYNRSKMFVCTNIKPANVKNYIYIESLLCYTMLMEDWITQEKPVLTK